HGAVGHPEFGGEIRLVGMAILADISRRYIVNARAAIAGPGEASDAVSIGSDCIVGNCVWTSGDGERDGHAHWWVDVGRQSRADGMGGANLVRGSWRAKQNRTNDFNPFPTNKDIRNPIAAVRSGVGAVGESDREHDEAWGPNIEALMSRTTPIAQ